jgi:hypothetical protein
MPQSIGEWWTAIGAMAAILGVVVAFMRRPRKTTNVVTGGSGNTLSGGQGTTRNVVKNGDNNTLSG